MRSLLCPLAAVVCLAAWTGGCGYDQVVNSWLDHSPPAAATGPKPPGHVYLLRGLTSVYSFGIDQLAAKIVGRGVTATVYGLSETGSLPNEIVRKYKAAEERGPIVLLGHSSGGDEIIEIARQMKAADVPVALAFGFDPTRLAGAVPSNVELFINLYQRFNPIGGGEVTAAPGFRGRLINVDLRAHTEIVHITLDKNPAVQDAVADKIVAVATAAAQQAGGARRKRLSAATELRPLMLRYVVPGNAPIVLWDDAVKIKVGAGATLASIAAAYDVPVWALAQINGADPGHPLEPGRMLIVPRSLDAGTTAARAMPPTSSASPARSRAHPLAARAAPNDALPQSRSARGGATHSAIAPASGDARTESIPAASSFGERWQTQQ